jgi:predicted transcriptional regulator
MQAGLLNNNILVRCYNIIMNPEVRRKVLDISVSPGKMEIIKRLAESGQPLSIDNLHNSMTTNPPSLENYLDKLRSWNLITTTNDQYLLTDLGKKVYKGLKETVKEMPAE